MVTLFVLLAATLTHSSIIEQWITNLELIQVASQLPIEPISAIKTRESHKFMYYGLVNGQVAVANTVYSSHISYISATHMQDIKLMDIIPIYRKMIVVLFESNSLYHISFVHLNYTQFDVQNAGIHRTLNFTNPLKMHFNENKNELILIHYNSAEIFHVSVFTSIDHEWNDFSYADIFLNVQMDINDNRLHCIPTENNSYILTTNTGCNTVVELDHTYSIKKIDFTVNSWLSMPEALKSIYIYSPMFGYISSSCMFQTGNQKWKSNPMNWLQTTLKQQNIHMHSIEAATMIQREMDVGVLLVINDNISDRKLMYLGAMFPLQSTEIVRAHHRRILMETPIQYFDALYGTNERRPKYPARLGVQQKPLVRKDAERQFIRPTPKPTAKPRVAVRRGKALALGSLLCYQQKLQPGMECYINRVRYEVIKKLGFGADGDVFFAKQYYGRNPRFKEVALKQFTNKAAFKRESNVLTLLNECPYSVKIFALSPMTELLSYIIVMEYVSGGDLKAFMLQPHVSTKDTLPIAIFRRYLMDIAEPLSILNDNFNVMHTDMKPENVLVIYADCEYPDDEPNIDFLLADMSVSLTFDQFASGQYAGTKRFFSPEMTAAVYFKIHKMRSKECVDGYGLVLVGIHLYGSLCGPRSHSDVLCSLASKFKQAMVTFEQNYVKGHEAAYEKLFQARSDATYTALTQLGQQALHPQASSGYKRAAELLRIVSSFLVRHPDTTKRHPYIFSGPSSCTDWATFKRQVKNVKYIAVGKI